MMAGRTDGSCRLNTRAALTSVAIFLSLTFIATGNSYSQSQDDEVIRLRYEVSVLKEKIRLQEEEKAKTDERIKAIEQMVASRPPSQSHPNPSGFSSGTEQTLPQVAEIAEQQTIDLLKENQQRTARDSVDILHKIPDYIPNYITKGLEFHGYFRSGYGVNDRGGKMQAFMAPDALAKYRLGNEQETYIETVFLNKNWNPDPDGVTLETQIRVAYQTQENQTWDPNNEVVLREMYGRMGHFVDWDPDIKVWAGQRFCRLPELDINDFWWYDMSGYGGGFEDINCGIGKLDVTFIGYASNDLNLSTQRGRVSKENINFKLGDVDVPLGKGMMWVNGGYVMGGTDTADSNIKLDNLAGVDVGFMHYVPGEKANNQFAVQYGCGSNTSLSAGALLPQGGDDSKSWRVRLTDMWNNQFNDKFSMQVVGVYQYTDYGHATKNGETWVSVGARPVYMLTKHFGLELEPGMDYINNPRDNYDTTLFKLTGAIRISAGTVFNARPEFRLYATYAKWGQGFRGNPLLGGEAFTNLTEGMNYGIQCENWW